MSKESDYDIGDDGSLPSENRETVSFLNENVLQQQIDALEAELKNIQGNLKQLLADGEAKRFCVENLANKILLNQFQACFEFFGEYVYCLQYKGTSDYEQEGQVTGSKRGPSRTLSPVNEFLLVLTRNTIHIARLLAISYMI